MQKNTYATSYILAGVGGIFLFFFFEDLILSLLCILLWVCIFLIFFFFIGKKSILLLVFGTLLSLVIGTLYSYSSFRTIESYLWSISPYVWLYNDYEGTVQSVSKRNEFYDIYVLKLLSVHEKDIDVPIQHLLHVPKNFQLHVGQHVRYSGKMYLFEDFEGFSYKNYMLSQGFYFSTRTSYIETVTENSSPLAYRIFIIREQLIEKLFHIFPSDEALFLWWILFWARESLPEDLQEDFNNSGLTHFIAVSGFNITLCIIFVTFLFWFLPQWGRIIAVITTIVAFSFFVGLGAPVVRASIMGILGYIFLQYGNTPRHITLLAFTALCMWLWSPLSLKYDVSLHLSFLAVIGIIYTQEYFKKIFFWVPEIFAIREASVLTMAALSFALPIMMFQFGQVSLLAPFANIAVTWTIPLAMLLGSITLLFSSFSPWLWEILWFFTWMLLHYDILIVRFFWNLDFALWKIDLGPYALYFQTLYFIFGIYIISITHLHTKK